MKSKNKGFTIMELLLAMAILAIIVPVAVSILTMVTQSFTGYEAANQMKSVNQETLNRMHLRLKGCKRIFQRDAAGLMYLVRLNPAPAPQRMISCQLPVIDATGNLAVATTSFFPASVGNVLYFTANTVISPLNNIQDSVGSTSTVKIDVYKFWLYYLTDEHPQGIFARPSYRLLEWQSKGYADYVQIVNSTTDTFKQQNIVKALYNRGVTCAWDSSQDVWTAFYTMSASGGLAGDVGHMIVIDKYRSLTTAITGVMGGGFRFGISPNSSGWPQAPKVVPQFAAAAGVFPGGFEVAIVGPAAGRKVMIRCVLVAQGSTKGFRADDQLVVTSARDLW